MMSDLKYYPAKKSEELTMSKNELKGTNLLIKQSENMRK